MAKKKDEVTARYFVIPEAEFAARIQQAGDQGASSAQKRAQFYALSSLASDFKTSKITSGELTDVLDRRKKKPKEDKEDEEAA